MVGFANRVLVADGQQISRLGLRTALQRAGSEVVADVSTARDAVSCAAEHRPHACVLDLSVSGDGIAAVRQIKREVPGTAVIVLSESPSTRELVDALRAGASGYVSNAIQPSELTAIVRAALTGSAAIPSALVPALVEDLPGRHRQRRRVIEGRLHVRLTSREWEVVELLHDGLATQQIAAELGVSLVTIRRHTSGVVRKLNARDRNAALETLRQAGL